MAARMLAVASTRTRSSLFLPARSMMSPVSVRKVVTVMVLSGPCAGRRWAVISSLTCPRRVVIVKLGERVGGYARASWPRRRVGAIESSPRSGGAAIAFPVTFAHGLQCRPELLGVIIASITFFRVPFEFQRVRTARGRGPIRRASSRASETDDEIVHIGSAFLIRVSVSMQMLLDNLVEKDEAGCGRRLVNGRRKPVSLPKLTCSRDENPHTLQDHRKISSVDPSKADLSREVGLGSAEKTDRGDCGVGIALERLEPEPLGCARVRPEHLLLIPDHGLERVKRSDEAVGELVRKSLGEDEKGAGEDDRFLSGERIEKDGLRAGGSSQKKVGFEPNTMTRHLRQPSNRRRGTGRRS